jgi:hypothetical protein
VLRVTIEMVPKGDESRKRVVAVGEIANNLGGGEESGNYDAWFSMFAPRTHEVWKYGKVEGFPRQKRGHWDLLFRALRDAVGSRNLQ